MFGLPERIQPIMGGGEVMGFMVEYVRRPLCRPGSRELGLEWERHPPPSDPLLPARPHF